MPKSLSNLSALKELYYGSKEPMSRRNMARYAMAVRRIETTLLFSNKVQALPGRVQARVKKILQHSTAYYASVTYIKGFEVGVKLLSDDDYTVFDSGNTGFNRVIANKLIEELGKFLAKMAQEHEHIETDDLRFRKRMRRKILKRLGINSINSLSGRQLVLTDEVLNIIIGYYWKTAKQFTLLFSDYLMGEGILRYLDEMNFSGGREKHGDAWGKSRKDPEGLLMDRQVYFDWIGSGSPLLLERGDEGDDL